MVSLKKEKEKEKETALKTNKSPSYFYKGMRGKCAYTAGPVNIYSLLELFLCISWGHMPLIQTFNIICHWSELLTVAVFSFVTLNFLSPVLKVGILSMHGPASVRPIKSTVWKSVGSTCTKWKHVNMVNLSGEALYTYFLFPSFEITKIHKS